ncbi:MAG: hypothetical protein ACXWVJ_05615 [Caulobacteraceae bacterium]
MNDRLFFSLLGLGAVLMITLALVWPQGLGAPSPPPFGHPLKPIEAKKPSGPAPSILTGLPTAPAPQVPPSPSDASPAQ